MPARPGRAFVRSSRWRRFHEIEEKTSMMMRLEDGRIASFNCNFGAADRSTFTVIHTRGSVTLDPAEEYVQTIKARVRPDARDRQRVFSKRDRLAAELDYFSQCIPDDHVPAPAGAEGLADVRIIDAMQRSITNGRGIDIRTSMRKRHSCASAEYSA